MKFNIVLSCILVCLLTVTYFFQEKRDEYKYERKKETSRLLNTSDLGDLISFRLPNVKIKKKEDDSFFIADSDIKVDNSRIDILFENLSALRIGRVFENDELLDSARELYFVESEEANDRTIKFIFEKGYLRFEVGRMLQTQSAFYTEVKKNDDYLWAVTFDSRPRETPYLQSEAHRDDTAYRRILSLLALEESFFYERSAFLEQTSLENVKAVDIDNTRNRAFSIDYKERKTFPRVFRGLSYDRDSMEWFTHEILSLKGEEITFDFDVDALSERRSVITIDLKNSQVKVLELFDFYQGRSGNFLLTRHLNVNKDENSRDEMRLIHISDDDRGLFFRNHQDFWLLYPVGDSVESMVVEFPRGEKIKVGLTITPRFEAQLMNSNVSDNISSLNHQSFSKLVDFLSKRASYVSVHLAESAVEDIDRFEDFEAFRNIFTLKVNGIKYIVVQTSSEVVMSKRVDDTFVRYHYVVESELPLEVGINHYVRY